MHFKNRNSMTNLTVNRLVRCHCNLQLQSAFADFDYDVLPWDIEMVIAEPDAVVDDNAVVADADAAALRDLQGPDYSTLKTWLRNNKRQLGDSGDSLNASVMMQAPGLGLNLLSYRPTGLLDN